MSNPQNDHSASAHMAEASGHLAMARDHLTVGAAEVLEAGAEVTREAGVAVAAKIAKLNGRGKGALRQAEALIREHPLASLGTACATAFVVGKLTRGR